MPTPQQHVYAPLAEVIRSGLREGVHFGTVVGLTASGEVGYARGDIEAPMFPRSSAKPLQALASLRAGAPITGPEIAIAAGSHNGEEIHTDLATKMLSASGLTPDALGCPADRPVSPRARTALVLSGQEPTRLHMNCSGKHAAMLAACVARGWDTSTYLDPGHPVQREVRAVLEEKCGEPVAHTAVDGCGAPQLAVSLIGLARGIRSLVLADEGTQEAAVVRAMRDFPEYVAGEGRDDTALMRGVPGLISKIGAEGVIVVAAPTGETVAVKLSDGDPLTRARTMVALTALRALGVDITPVRHMLSAPVLGGGEPVGEIRPLTD
ncbi:L-asparaginase II [Nocardiopsis mwathae]|uniref:L-asparaginase II n=1 Tax=Nocardiopsis mwathae TaxID=1472723 RepID=A0A7W9YJK0_9ACTN|nr:asparaginase [Nocardiopsis mwathae]MBB6173145.1 L-asparaginase II [Nocardiopsis mwathae]